MTMTYPYPATDHGPDDAAGAVDDKAGGLDSIPASGHRNLSPDVVMAIPLSDSDADNGLPDVARYEGPSVPDQPALVNPSVGNQGPVEQGMNDINPQGSSPVPGSAGPANYNQAPDDSSKGNPH